MSGTRQRRFLSKGERSFLAAPAAEPWTPLRRSMLESPAWRALSRAGLQFLTRLCLENMAHAGRENGNLALGYDEIQQQGIHRSMIFQTINEVVELGFVRCTREGRFAWGADPGRRATYRLTFLGTVGDHAGPATDDWRLIGSDLEASLAVQRGKRAKPAKTAAGKANGRYPTRDIEYSTQNRLGT